MQLNVDEQSFFSNQMIRVIRRISRDYMSRGRNAEQVWDPHFIRHTRFLNFSLSYLENQKQCVFPIHVTHRQFKSGRVCAPERSATSSPSSTTPTLCSTPVWTTKSQVCLLFYLHMWQIPVCWLRVYFAYFACVCFCVFMGYSLLPPFF